MRFVQHHLEEMILYYFLLCRRLFPFPPPYSSSRLFSTLPSPAPRCYPDNVKVTKPSDKFSSTGRFPAINTFVIPRTWPFLTTHTKHMVIYYYSAHPRNKGFGNECETLIEHWKFHETTFYHCGWVFSDELFNYRNYGRLMMDPCVSGWPLTDSM